ncbi:MAG: DUF4105 domain-containing protein [Muribaculaceae bacterium]|nr:DUF4105 domain-containing protein [Muribaculaceae bacterium]
MHHAPFINPRCPSLPPACRHRVVVLLLVAWLATALAEGQPAVPAPAAGDTAAVATDSVTVSLVTFYPGEEPFAIYGHTELRVQQDGRDWYYNYGVFDFEAPGFVWRFVTGDAEYLCVPIDKQYALMGMEGRRMVEQRLNLTADEAHRVADRLLWNALPDNRAYHYRYLTDNCSTRPRDIIEAALHDGVLHYGEPQQGEVTYRQMIRHYCRNYAWQQLGIDLVLGSRLDQPLDYREQMFIPMVLMEAVGGATVTRDSVSMPLVTRTDVVVDASEQGLVLPPTPWWRTPLAAALLVLALAVALTVRDVRQRRTTRWFDALLYGTLAAIGTVITLLALCSSHEALWPNWNLLWAHPLHWLPAASVWLVPRSRCLMRGYHAANAAVMVAALALWAIVPQGANYAFFPLMAASLLRSASFLATGRKQR